MRAMTLWVCAVGAVAWLTACPGDESGPPVQVVVEEAEPAPEPEPEPRPEPEAAAAAPEPKPPEPPTPKMPIPAPDDVRRPPKGTLQTESGVFYRRLVEGSGKINPTPSSAVRVHYTGWTTDGKMFDSSYKGDGDPAEFRLDGVIAGWTDGVSYMVEGDKMRFWIPEKMAYKGKPGRPAGMLVFDIELLRILSP